MSYTPPGPHFGMPQAGQFIGLSSVPLAWGAATSGTARATAPVAPGSLVVMAFVSNNAMTVSSIVGLGSPWLMVGESGSSNFSGSGLWFANVPRLPALAPSVNVTWNSGSLPNNTVVAFSARRPVRLVRAAAAFGAGTTLTIGPISDGSARLAVSHFFTRTGVLTGDPPAGWTQISSNAANGGEMLAYRWIAPGESVSIVWSTSADNCSGQLGLFG